MFRRIFLLFLLLFISVGISYLLILDFPIVINAGNYELIMNSKFLIFICTFLVLFVYASFFILVALFYPNTKRYEKKQKRLEQKFSDYVDMATKAFIHMSMNENKQGWKELRLAKKLFGANDNLNYFLESHLYYSDKKYKQSEDSFRNIKNLNLNSELIELKIGLNEAVKNMDDKKIQEHALKIIKIEPTNKLSTKELFRIFVKNNDWVSAEKIIQLGLKSKVFYLTKYKNDIIFVYTALGKYYYDNNNFFSAKKSLRYAYEISNENLSTNILLARTYIALNKNSKAIRIIEKAWSQESHPKLAELYFSLFSEKDANKLSTIEKLYRKNPKSFDSHYLMAKYYLANEMFTKARKYSKAAENIDENSDIYELMLEIEKKDNGSSAIVSNLRQKMLNSKRRCWKCRICKREYANWEPQCMNCKFHDSIVWE